MRVVVLCAALALTSVSAASADDAQLIGTYRRGMQSIVRHVIALPLSRTTVPSRVERENARLMWRSFLDYEMGLEAIRAAHAGFVTARSHDADFRLFHGAWLAQYRNGVDFIAAMSRHPEYHKLLNESERSLGLTRGSYANFKFHWLNVRRAAEFTALGLMDATFGGTPVPGATEDQRALLIAGAGKGTRETIRNAARVIESTTWAPIPAGLEVVGGGKEKPPPRAPFVTKQQIAEMHRTLQPGDIIFERREWALSNVGLPGFWPHVALYAGTPEERRKAFGDAFEEGLKKRDQKRYETQLSKGSVVEAIGEGVIVSTFEHSASADFVAVIRPRVTAAVRSEAIARAIAYVGRPYDFDFDFLTGDRIVCTELIYKAYEGALHFPVMTLAGRSVTPANDFVRWFDVQYDRGRELAFVAFYDGHTHLAAAKRGDVGLFRASWKRPRWHTAVERE